MADADTEEQRRQQAEDEQDRLEQVAEDAQQQVNQAQAQYALNGLLDTRVGFPHATPAVSVMVDPKYRAAAVVTTDPVLTFRNTRRSSSGRWAIDTLSNAGSTHNDDLVVYSDMGAPTREPISEEYTFTEVTESTSRIMITINDDDHADLIASSQFPRGGNTKEFPFTIDSDPTVNANPGDGPGLDDNPRNDYDTVRFSGSFAGASGTFECMGMAMDDCKIKHEGGSRYSVDSTTWTFTTSRTATVLVDDDSYMYFGWWRRMQLDNETYSFATFSGGMHPASGTGFNNLVGTATYNGTAVGQYAVYQPLGTQSGTGSFTANARLDADFENNMLSGEVTSFSNASDWSLTLNTKIMTGGSVSEGTVDWTIAGNTESGGEWEAQFFSDVTPYVSHIPEGVAGQFDAVFNDVGRLTGAFGAHCPTSTCPRR